MIMVIATSENENILKPLILAHHYLSRCKNVIKLKLRGVDLFSAFEFREK